MTVKALFIRHSESTGNAQHLVKGAKEYPLDAKGKEESQKLATRIARYKPTIVVTSPLGRAKVPAQDIARRAKVSLHVDKQLLPQRFGTLTGTPAKQGEPIISKMSKEEPDRNVGGSKGQSFNSALKQNDSAMRRIKMRIANGERPAVVTHSRVLRNLPHSLFGSKPKDPTKGGPEPSGLIILDSRNKLQTHAPVGATRRRNA